MNHEHHEHPYFYKQWNIVLYHKIQKVNDQLWKVLIINQPTVVVLNTIIP